MKGSATDRCPAPTRVIHTVTIRHLLDTGSHSGQVTVVHNTYEIRQEMPPSRHAEAESSAKIETGLRRRDGARNYP